MAITQFNGSKVTYATATTGNHFENAYMTSLTISGGGRPDVDIVTSTARYSKAGLAEPRRVSIGMILDDPNGTDLENMITQCGSSQLTITTYVCDTPSTFFQEDAFCMSYDISSAVDGVLEVTIEFLIDES